MDGETAADERADVPFAGLRRHARALTAGIVLLVVTFLVVPDLAPQTDELPPVQLVHGRVIELLEAEDPSEPDVRIEVVTGIVAAVPVTTMVAVWLTGRRLPFVGDGSGMRPAPGWD